MTELLLAVCATAASMAVMWAVCLRPMRHGRAPGAPPAADTAAELAGLRAEVAALREQSRAG